MLAKFSELNPKGLCLSLEKEKETFCVAFTYSVKRECEIRKFHAALVDRAAMAKKCAKKRDARAKLLFY